MDDDGAHLGTAELSVEAAGGRTTLTQAFEIANGARDTIAVVVDGDTLKPVSSQRDILESDGDEERIEVEYTQDGALIRQGDRQSGLSVPEHSYDNDTSLFLWRTLPFAVDYEGSYNTIITNHRTRQKVNLRVMGRESVTVPAGTFDAWRLEITTSNARQIAWFADTPERPLVRYDNDRNLIFELTESP